MNDRNVVRHEGHVTREDREMLLGQRGAVVWLTGLSGSGKSTIAYALESRLARAGRLAYVLDGDNLRHGLNDDLGFSDDDRRENVRRVGEVAALLADAGVVAIASLISPFRSDRDRVRRRVAEGRFFEVFVNTPLAICEQRDTKGFYAKARAGELPEFTGVSSPYEAPERPELLLLAGNTSVEEDAEAVERLLRDAGVV
ncbi:MAG: adenylyl-sulfate kinase [Acidobacteria bacterium]|nr:adenylyl-sulfate kinase [Acidobacteriota bacterium]